MMPRRQFLRATAATGAALTVFPQRLLHAADSPSPNAQITLAAIGVGDMGRRDLESFLKQPGVRAVAVCDVDAKNRGAAQEMVNKTHGNKDCKAYTEFRELLAQEKGLDAVLVVTPDHTHAPIAAAAMRAGKHVYCQKPMTHTVTEARRLGEIARERKVATQLGTGNQAAEGPRRLREWIEDGAIGGVRNVHIWSNRPLWPQGIERPKDTPPVPASLNWDLWLGPAPERPFHPAYLPLVWRGWRDFGTGALGDMGCYAFDTVFRVLSLQAPVSVEASGSGFAEKMWAAVTLSRETYPQASFVTWQFPGRAAMPPVAVHWYDGGLRPPRPRDLEPDRPLAIEGMYFVGDRGVILTDFTGDNPRLIPEARMKSFKAPPARLPKSIGHHAEWLRAIRGGEPGGANFEFSSRVTEALLLGNVALSFPGQSLAWDADAFRVPHPAEANKHLHFEYRQGWTL